MFGNYFAEQATAIETALAKNLKRRGVASSGKTKNLKTYQAIYDFLKNHIPSEFSLAAGRVRNNRQMLKHSCDVLIYKRWCERYFDLSGGYVLADNLHAFMSLEANLEAPAITMHVGLTSAMKSLYIMQKQQLEEDGNAEKESQHLVPLYSILFSYTSSRSLLYIKQNIEKVSEQKEIPLNRQVDMVCVLNKGILIKNWEAGGVYQGIETGRDTLMWFYVILTEYLDREGSLQLNLRDYIKSGREYNEC